MKLNRRNLLALLGSGAMASVGGLSFRRSKMKSAETNRDGSIMPVVFLGHGSPMNAIEENKFTEAFQKLGRDLPKPKAILMISAHWMTKGSWVTHMNQPKTIHDFYGFPRKLFEVQYPAPGKPELAEEVKKIVVEPPIHLDDQQWGLDHGTWSVLTHLYPLHDIPVVQLSLDMSQPPAYHYELGQKLRELREQGVLIMGSGNIVHNLGRIKWEEDATPFDWAVEFDQWVASRATDRDFTSLVKSATDSPAGRLSIPTLDHYLPLLYILGASTAQDRLTFDVEGLQNGSISMRSLRFG